MAFNETSDMYVNKNSQHKPHMSAVQSQERSRLPSIPATVHKGASLSRFKL